MFTIPQEISLFGVSLHTYGLIVGLSLVVGLTFSEKIVMRAGYTSRQFWQLAGVAVVGGLIGARLWHVMTDWPLYVSDPVAAFYIWNGGLSIIGAVVGGIVAVSLVRSRLPHLVFFDAVSIVLPFSQAIGRLANWVNQELFGLPSTLPWAITIDKANRPVGFTEFATFHPLFLYEALLMVGVGCLLWWLYKQALQTRSTKQSKLMGAGWASSFTLGSGRLLALYIFLYSLIRFILDFLRIEKAQLPILGLGINQVVLFVLMVASVGWIIFRRNKVTAK